MKDSDKTVEDLIDIAMEKASDPNVGSVELRQALTEISAASRREALREKGFPQEDLQ